jgi:hypothetical protein
MSQPYGSLWPVARIALGFTFKKGKSGIWKKYIMERSFINFVLRQILLR